MKIRGLEPKGGTSLVCDEVRERGEHARQFHNAVAGRKSGPVSAVWSGVRTPIPGLTNPSGDPERLATAILPHT